MTKQSLTQFILFLAVLSSSVLSTRAEDFWLADNTHLYGMIRAVNQDQSLTVWLPSGDERTIPLETIVEVRFLGRNPLLVQSGTQEFRFITGSRLRGRIDANTGDSVRLTTAMAGPVEVDLSKVQGLVALPLRGLIGRKSEELLEQPASSLPRALDLAMDTRGATYPGFLRKLEPDRVTFDHEELQNEIKLNMLYLAGLRLADGGRAPATADGGLFVSLLGRDGSVVDGRLRNIRLGRWQFLPRWDQDKPFMIDEDEITCVQVLGGKVQYLSQMMPVEVKEGTLLTPPQPYKLNQSCQGDPISIAGKRYPWGIGVHANSELTFALDGKFKEFRSDIGIATRMADRGSVIFTVLGDGKELYKSPVVRGGGARTGSKATADGQALPVKISVEGIKRLVLKVTDANDTDLSDAANWGSARVLR